MTVPQPETVVLRHKTAIRRGDFSRPVKCLMRDGLLEKNLSFFDYGCGRGEDLELLTNDAMSPLFEAVIEATEEAIYNSMLRARTMTGNGHTVEALPIDKTLEILRQYRSVK